MANTAGAVYLYTETRLNLDEAYTGSTIELSTSSHQRTILTSSQSPVDINESAFSKQLTSDASIFFRHDSKYPRSFLWRVLDERHILELQSIDLTQDPGERVEALLTVRLRFSNAIRPYCVGFADHDEKDALVVFAVTTAGELFTITLVKDVFVHLKATEALQSDWCRNFGVPALRVREPFRLTAMGTEQLFVSLSDGALLKLETSSNNHNSWRETYFTAPGWNLPRALAKWKGHSFAKFGDIELNPSTALSVALSPDGGHIITVCLNHTLRIWDATTGKISMQADLTEHDDQKVQGQPKFLISPTQRQSLQVLDVTGRAGDSYYIVTFSPKNHEFNFWAVLDAGLGEEGISRLSFDTALIPPLDELMETSAWTLEEFYINANPGWSKTQLWLRARSGPISRAFSVSFNLFDDNELAESWKNGWSAVSPGRQSIQHLGLDTPPKIQIGDVAMHCPDISSRWLDFFFIPGRFTISTLETALHVYAKGASNTNLRTTTQSKAPLKERLSSAISKKAAFALIGANHDQREIKVSEEWQLFYGLVQDLHKRRTSAISFVYDQVDKLPWIVSADLVSPVRQCSELAVCDLHRQSDRAFLDPDQVAKRLNTSYEPLDLLNVAHSFRASLSTSFIDEFRRHIQSVLVADPISSIGDRMASLHQQVDFAGYVGEEDWDRLYDLLEDHGGYDVLDYKNFVDILEQMSNESTGKRNQEQITRYGSRALIRTAQENTSLYTHTLVDLLLLVVYVETEVDMADLESGMQSPWKGQDLYIAILDKLREQSILNFLMTNVRTEKSKKERRLSVGDSPTAARSSISEPSPPAYTSTLLESLFIGDWASIHIPSSYEMPELLSYWAQRWISDMDLGTQYDSFAAHVLADLIKHKYTSQALEFLAYVPTSAWSTYLKGRLNLLLGETDQAAMHFNKAAHALSLTDIASFDTADLLRPDEQSLFRSTATYYEHIMNLFDTLKSSSHVVQFAQSALQLQDFQPAQPPPKKQKLLPPSSPTNLLSRLFTAALDSAQYDTAYSSLVQLPAPLRKASLTQFIDTLLRSHNSPLLLSYPFATLSADLDSELTKKAKSAVSPHLQSQYFRLLYALRIKKGDFRSAAQSLFDLLSRLKSRKSQDARTEREVQAVYLMLVNVLVCCGEDDAWVLSGDDGEGRRVVFLEDVRAEYRALLDELSAVQEGRFSFGGADEMEVDVL